MSTPENVIQRYVEAFNAGDEDGLAACFAVDGFILDGMAPHVWSGPSATRQWFRDALAEAGHLGVTDFHMVLGAPTEQPVSGDSAYFVARARIDAASLAASPDIRLYPGMPAEVLIIHKARLAIDYLTSPVVESFNRAFRED